MPIRAVIFDRDNTLMRFDAAAIERLEARIAAAAPALASGAAVAQWLRWPGPWPRTAAEEPAFWRAFWGDLAQRARLPGQAVAELQQIGAFYPTCFAAFPDTGACLEQLRARGLRLAVLTNFELPSVDITLRHAGIEPAWFDALLSSASLGVRKPDSRAYRAAAHALGLPPAQCAFVDDRDENVAAAHALGMRAWQIDRQGGDTSRFPCIRHLADLADLLALADSGSVVRHVYTRAPR